jgi:hypothetical protein
MSYSNGPKMITTGLVMCLDAGNIKSYPGSGTSWTDLSKNNNATLNNGPTFSNANGGGIVFDGTDDVIQVNTDVLLTGDYTLEVGFNRTGAMGDWVRMFGHSNNTNDRFWGLWIPNSFDYVLWQSYTGGGQIASNGYSFSINRYHVISFTKTSTTGRFYINGTSMGSGTIGTINYAGNISKILIGHAGFETGRHVGPLYYARIYDRGLSEAEVRQNYNANKGRFGL